MTEKSPASSIPQATRTEFAPVVETTCDDSPEAPRPFRIEVAERVRRLPPYLFATINRTMHERRQSGIDMIDLGMGNPSEPPAAIVIDKLAEAAKDPRNHGYSPATGIINLRKELCAKYLRKYGVRLDAATETLACLGSKEGFSHMCLALLGPGDNAIVPAPSYPAHLHGVVLAGGNAIALEVADSERFLSNVAYTCQNLYPRPKVVVVNFPHNPSGVTVEPGFYVELVKLARRFGFMVLSDVAYADVTFDGYQAPTFLAASGAKEVGVEFTTMSKGYNMAGWRVGFCAGNAEMVRALSSIKGYYDYGMFRAIQIAAIIALRDTDEQVAAQAKIYERRRNVLCQGLSRLGWNITVPRAGMFVWAPIPEPWRSKMDSIQFAMKLLQEADVAVSPGTGFGPAGEGYLRMALVENEERLRQAVRQMGRCLQTGNSASGSLPAVS